RARSGDEKGRGGAGKVGHALRLTGDHWLAEAGHRSNQKHSGGEVTRFCFHVHFSFLITAIRVCPSAKVDLSAWQRACRSLRIAAVKHPVRDSRQRLENDGAGLDTGDARQVSPGNQIGGGLSRTEANRHKLAVAVSDSGICEDGDGLALPQSFCVRPIVELK